MNDVGCVRVLVVDDNENDFALAADLLRRAEGASFSVEWASTFAAGLVLIRQSRHDAVLVDVNLGPDSGLDLIRAATAEGFRGPFILLTGHRDPKVDREALAAGAADFLLKGKIDTDVLERSIRYAVERTRARLELERQSREILRSNRELEDFARAVSHDLRAPLHVVAGHLELFTLRYQGQIDERGELLLERAMAGVGRAEALIADLLAYARLDAIGQADERVNTESAFDAVVGDLSELIAESGARLSRGPLPVVQGNLAQIELVIRNLLGNALKFRASRPPVVRVSADVDGDRWVFHVEDNGIGIEPEDAVRVFGMFARLNPADKYPGTGIGLAVCKKVVEGHGGRLWVTSTPRVGSTFHFTLPAPVEP